MGRGCECVWKEGATLCLSKPSLQEKAYIARVLVGVALACGNEVSQVLVKVLSLSNNCTCEA